MQQSIWSGVVLLFVLCLSKSGQCTEHIEFEFVDLFMIVAVVVVIDCDIPFNLNNDNRFCVFSTSTNTRVIARFHEAFFSTSLLRRHMAWRLKSSYDKWAAVISTYGARKIVNRLVRHTNWYATTGMPICPESMNAICVFVNSRFAHFRADGRTQRKCINF